MHHRQFGLFFAVLGTFASLCNVFIIIVFNSNKALRSRSQFFVALAVGDIIFGLGFVLTAVHDNNEHQAVNQSNTVLSCWLQLHWICVQVGPWLAMTMTLALTLERAAAVFLPYWYKTCFRQRHRLIAIGIGCLLTAVHSAITFFLALLSKDVNLDTCARMQASRKSFSMVSISLIALNYIFCFCLNLFSYYRTRSKTQRRESRELQRIRLISWISFLSTMSVVVPFCVLLVHVSLLSNPATTPIQDSSVILIFSLIPIDSASNLFLYVWLKRLFRLQAKRVLCMLFRGSDERNAPQLPVNVSDSLLTNIKTGPSMTELLVSTTL